MLLIAMCTKIFCSKGPNPRVDFHLLVDLAQRRHGPNQHLLGTSTRFLQIQKCTRAKNLCFNTKNLCFNSKEDLPLSCFFYIFMGLGHEATCTQASNYMNGGLIKFATLSLLNLRFEFFTTNFWALE